jgi:hypothetical protein
MLFIYKYTNIQIWKFIHQPCFALLKASISSADDGLSAVGYL